MPRTHWGQHNAAERPAQPEYNSGEYLVETENYVPLKLQLTTLMAAGQRLKRFRAAAFDFAHGTVDDNFEDPTRRPDFDLADASEIMKSIQNRHALRMAEKKAAENPPAEPPETPPEQPEE